MTEIYFALSLIGLLIAWSLWTKVALDDCRDRLFDLRDQLRDHFLAKQQLSSPVYAEYRDIINDMIRFTEKLSIWSLIVHWIAEPQVKSALDKVSDLSLQGADPATLTFLKNVRSTAGSALLVYLVETSIPLLIIANFLMLTQFVRTVNRSFGELRDEIARRMMRRWLSPFSMVALARASSSGSNLRTLAACAKVIH